MRTSGGGTVYPRYSSAEVMAGHNDGRRWDWNSATSRKCWCSSLGIRQDARRESRWWSRRSFGSQRCGCGCEDGARSWSKASTRVRTSAASTASATPTGEVERTEWMGESTRRDAQARRRTETRRGSEEETRGCAKSQRRCRASGESQSREGQVGSKPEHERKNNGSARHENASPANAAKRTLANATKDSRKTTSKHAPLTPRPRNRANRPTTTSPPPAASKKSTPTGPTTRPSDPASNPAPLPSPASAKAATHRAIAPLAPHRHRHKEARTARKTRIRSRSKPSTSSPTPFP